MVEPQDEKTVDAESEEMVELEELVRAQDAKRKAKSDGEEEPPSTS